MDKRLLRDLTKLVGKAIGDFNLIQDGDRILVALSGGKDSWTLLHALLKLQRKAPVQYEIKAVTVDPSLEGIDLSPLEQRLEKDHVAHEVIRSKIVKIVDEHLSKGTNPCSFCARLRRGVLYSYASREGWNKIAIGHHLDDFIETLLMNMFFNGAIKGMSPDLLADDQINRVIRPLVYVKEDKTRVFAGAMNLPIIDCLCPYQEEKRDKRKWVKSLIDGIETQIPDVKTNLLSSMGRVMPRHLLKPLEDGPY